MDVDAVEAVLTGWCKRVLLALSGQTPVGVRIDGKTLRGSKRQGPATVIYCRRMPDIGMVLAQQGVDDKTTELGVIDDFLLGVALQGRVVTTDALLTQHTVALQIVEQGGDYVLPVKENQPLTHAAIACWFEHPAPYDWPNGAVRACEKQHRRLTQWQIQTSSALNDYLEWPGLAQVFKITCQVTFPKTGQTGHHTR